MGVFKDPHTAAQLFRKNQRVFALVFRMTSHFPKGQLVKTPHAYRSKRRSGAAQQEKERRTSKGERDAVVANLETDID